MIEKITQIVSEYTKIPGESLRPETEIGRGAVNNSILLHRMYAAISREGIAVQNYQEIKTFGDLINTIGGDENPATPVPFNSSTVSSQPDAGNGQAGIGIDIEEVSQMPEVSDFREDDFYKMNFTPQEIAYCILQPEPYISFTGLFAAKEAIVKAENYYKKLPFNAIFIDHLPGGKPVYNGFIISISHTETLAIAVAVKEWDNIERNVANREEELVPRNNLPLYLLSVTAILLALLAICISLFKK